MEQEGPWETMRAEQENGELLSEDERMEASKEFREEEPQGSVKEDGSANFDNFSMKEVHQNYSAMSSKTTCRSKTLLLPTKTVQDH
uniref:Uncharacterized protein n=1 Tax=Magallana gigas TaxID=29159 RepID=K1QGK7_MAGGI